MYDDSVNGRIEMDNKVMEIIIEELVDVEYI